MAERLLSARLVTAERITDVRLPACQNAPVRHSPLSLPDGRWDKMAYGVHDCEEFLRAIS